jgi:hypothetical protein
MNKGEFAQARAALDRALKIVSKKFGLEHPTTADVLYALGSVHSVEHDYDQVRLPPLSLSSASSTGSSRPGAGLGPWCFSPVLKQCELIFSFRLWNTILNVCKLNNKQSVKTILISVVY